MKSLNAKEAIIGTRLIEDKRYRVITKAVISLIFNLSFAFYNGILGIVSASVIFSAFSVYYLLLSSMRFSAVLLERKKEEKASVIIGTLLIILSVILQVIVFVSIKYQTAKNYGKITMITIATFTFAKISMAVLTAIKCKNDNSRLFKAINTIRYSEVAVSLLTMQQSMLVSFDTAADGKSIILNAVTGAGVCFFIFALGIITLNSSRKEDFNGKIKNS